VERWDDAAMAQPDEGGAQQLGWQLEIGTVPRQRKSRSIKFLKFFNKRKSRSIKFLKFFNN
jgi:hypothetical protein